MTDSARTRKHDEGEGGHGEHDSPKHAAEEDTLPEVRPTTPAEERGESIETEDNPPEAEGSRETVEEDENT